jgi:hypothetical protein
METVYLPNGQACYLKEKIGNKYVVNKIFEDQDEYGYPVEIEDNSDILVDIVFNNKPIEKIASEIKELQEKREQEIILLKELENKSRALQHEIDKATKTQIANNKLIINRTELINAKTLALFEKDRINPFLLNSSDKSFYGLKLSLEITISNGEERGWGYKLYNDYNRGGGDFLCPKYGILINPTEEEIIETARRRAQELDFSDWVIKSTDDKYLTIAQIEKKKDFIDKDKIKEKETLERALKDMQEKLLKLQEL